MHVLALGDAPTAAIAVVAILLGLFVVARGQRGDRRERGERADEEAAPSLLAVPVAAPGSADAPQQLETMAVHDIGHGTSRLAGVASPRTDPEAVHEPAMPVEHQPGGDVASPGAASQEAAPQDAAPEPVSASSALEASAPAPEQAEPAPSYWTAPPAEPAPPAQPAPEPVGEQPPAAEPAAVPPQPASPEPPSARSRVPFRGKIRLRRPRGR